MATPEPIIAAVDIGTYAVKVVIAEVGADGAISVLGVGRDRTEGARAGKVINVPQVGAAVEHAIDDAEQMSGMVVRRVHVATAGGFIRSINRMGMAPVRRNAVMDREVHEVRRTAMAMPLAPDERILAVVSQGFAVDDTVGVRDPRGMAAKCLYGRYHVVTTSEQAANNACRCCDRLDLAVDGVHPEPLVSALAVVDDDERELGVLVLDIGAGATSVAAYRDFELVHTGTLPLGGAQLIADLAHGLKTPAGEAERLLEAVGCVDETQVIAGETCEIPGLGPRPSRTLSRSAIVEVLQPRVEELLTAAARSVNAADVLPDELDGGLVITGGVANLAGLCELAGQVLGLPARVGLPRGFGGLSRLVERPDFAAACGVLRRAAEVEGNRPQAARISPFERLRRKRLGATFRDATVDYL